MVSNLKYIHYAHIHVYVYVLLWRGSEINFNSGRVHYPLQRLATYVYRERKHSVGRAKVQHIANLSTQISFFSRIGAVHRITVA